jgi:hypothetical protein
MCSHPGSTRTTGPEGRDPALSPQSLRATHAVPPSVDEDAPIPGEWLVARCVECWGLVDDRDFCPEIDGAGVFRCAACADSLEMQVCTRTEAKTAGSIPPWTRPHRWTAMRRQQPTRGRSEEERRRLGPSRALGVPTIARSRGDARAAGAGQPGRAAADAAGKRSAPVSARHRPARELGPRPPQNEPQCAFCRRLMLNRRRNCRYCSGRCRAAASFERRVTAAVERELSRWRDAGGSPESQDKTPTSAACSGGHHRRSS